MKTNITKRDVRAICKKAVELVLLKPSDYVIDGKDSIKGFVKGQKLLPSRFACTALRRASIAYQEARNVPTSLLNALFDKYFKPKRAKGKLAPWWPRGGIDAQEPRVLALLLLPEIIKSEDDLCKNN